MPVGYRPIKIAYLIDLALDGHWTPTNRELDLLFWAVDRHLQELTRPEKLSEGNHGIFQLHGLRMLAEMAWNSPRKAQSDCFIAVHLPRLIRNQFNQEGVHLEHSPHYHWWMQEELRSLAESGWYSSKLTHEIQAVCNRAEEVKHWFRTPTGHLVRIGDTPDEAIKPQPAVPPAPDVVTDRYEMRVFRGAGYAACRNEQALLFFHCAYHSKSHKHRDDLHFDLHDYGRAILIDGGSCGYKVGPERQYLVSTAAHNTIQIDDENYPRDGTDAYGSAIESTEALPDRVRFQTQVDHASMGVSHRRCLEFLPQRALYVRDTVSCNRPRRTTQWHHFAPSWRLQSRHDSRAILTDGEFVLKIECQGGYLKRVHFGEREPVMRGWRAVDRRLVPSWSLGFVAYGSKIDLETLIEYTAPAANPT